MDAGGDLYRQMLAAASHSTLQRHTQLHQGDGRHTVGNVFLPALQHRTGAQSALSMKHLEVIEQCILAENRRETQLAQCASEREKKYLVKKFQAQRAHERDLIHALMLGHPSEDELVVGESKSKSPLRSEKLFKMAGEKTFATTTSAGKRQPTKAVSPRHHQPPSPARRKTEEEEASVLVSPGKKKVAGCPLGRDRPSGSASPVRKPPLSPKTREMKLPHALATSPLKPAPRSSPHHESKSPSPVKRKKIKPVATEIHEAAAEEEKETYVFDGATSFHDAREQAMAMARDHRGLVDGDTQTTARPCSRTIDLQSSSKFVLMLTTDTTEERGAVSPTRRPHSSPEQRRRRPSAEAHVLPSLGHSLSQPGVEVFHKAEPGVLSEPPPLQTVQSYVSLTNSAKAIHVVHADKVSELLDARGVWCEQEAVAEPAVAVEAEVQPDTEWTGYGGDAPTTDWSVAPDEMEARAADDDQGWAYSEAAIAQEEPGSTVQDDQLEEPVEPGDEGPDHDIVSVIYDLIHRIEEAAALESEEMTALIVDTAAVVEPAPETRRVQLMNFSRFVTQIQAAFRGHRSRRAFRLALYQEALQCGVLGAMPGTLQGHSGWYQDPKTYMAYYFAVLPDGEWRQKVVLRCSGLILTGYQMQEQILSRVASVD